MAISQAPKSPGKSAPRTPTVAATTANVTLSPRDEARKEAVTGIFGLGSLLAIMRGAYADAGAISIHGPKIAREVTILGRSNEQIGKALDILGQGGPYMGIMGACLPLVVQLGINHDRIDGNKVSGIPGVMSKGALENKVKGELAENELEALREQQEAEQKLTELKAQMNGEVPDASVPASAPA
jgi:hypothetical protein